MWQKVVWITFGMTLAFWVGCAHEGPVGLESSPVLESDGPVAVAPQPVSPHAAAAKPVVHAQRAIQAADLAAPSLRGIDRHNWNPIVVGPASGAVPHHPIYFDAYCGDRYLLTPDRPSPLVGEHTHLDASAVASTAGSRAHIDGRDLRDLFVAPLKTAGDLATFPVQAVATPPWDIHYSSGFQGEPIDGQP